MSVLSKLTTKKNRILEAIHNMPEQFRAERNGGFLARSFAIGAGIGATISAFGLTTRAMATPYAEQSGDLAIPEIIITAGAVKTSFDLAKKASAKAGEYNTPISTRAGLMAGALSAGLMTLPLHERYNEAIADVINNAPYSPAIAARYITDAQHEVTRKIWTAACPVVKEAISTSDVPFGSVECP